MKKILILILGAASFCLSVHAQEKSIEVIVEDTVLVKPDIWYYLIKFDRTAGQMTKIATDTGSTNDESDSSEMTENELIEKNILTIKALVRKYGIVINDSTKERLSFNLPKTKQNVEYFGGAFTSRSSLDSFIKHIDQYDGVLGGIWSNYAENTDENQLRLYAKLLAAAKKKAIVLSELTGRRLGDIVVITEVDGYNIHSIISSLDNLIKLSLYKANSEEVATLYNEYPYQIKLKGSLKVKFAIK